MTINNEVPAAYDEDGYLRVEFLLACLEKTIQLAQHGNTDSIIELTSKLHHVIAVEQVMLSVDNPDLCEDRTWH